jgi:histidyl-tRNA synthetase
MTVQRPRGTRDFLPEEMQRRGQAKGAMQDVLKRWGYREVATPTFEHLDLFTLKSGPSVVEEIYSFKDKGGRDLALRPELTAPVMRMYVSELQNSPKPQRLWYFGNCFRYERPQKGRYREFWQMGAEIIGGSKPDSEAEAVVLAEDMLKSVGICGDIHIGYLGLIRSILGQIAAEHRSSVMRMIDKKERDALAELLEEIDCSHLGLLELIDSKGDPAMNKAAQIAGDLRINREPLNTGDISSHAAEYQPKASSGRDSAREGRAVEAELNLDQFEETVDLLKAYGADFTIDFEIVRGLEYYSGTVFEIYAQGLGAQRQICGGGTYELASLFGGKETSSTGFGLGFDRIMEIAKMEGICSPPLYLAFTPDVKKEAAGIARDLRKSFPVIMDVMGRSLGAQIKAAAGSGADYVAIVGRDEIECGKLALRDMKGGEQESLSLAEIEEKLKAHFQRLP